MDKSINAYERKLSWKEAKKIIKKGNKHKYGPILIAIKKSQEWRFRINLKKEVKPAHKRNYIKRVIREVYRTSKPKIDDPHIVVFTVLNNIPDLDFHEFKNEYLNYFSKNNE